MKKPLIIVFRIFIITALYILIRSGLTEFTNINEHLVRILSFIICFSFGYEFIVSKLRGSTAKEKIFTSFLGFLLIIIVFSIVSVYVNY